MCVEQLLSQMSTCLRSELNEITIILLLHGKFRKNNKSEWRPPIGWQTCKHTHNWEYYKWSSKGPMLIPSLLHPQQSAHSKIKWLYHKLKPWSTERKKKKPSSWGVPIKPDLWWPFRDTYSDFLVQLKHPSASAFGHITEGCVNSTSVSATIQARIQEQWDQLTHDTQQASFMVLRFCTIMNPLAPLQGTHH